MHVALDKNKRAKQTVIFIHGLGSSASMWQDITPKINNARVVSVDLLGFGSSPKPKWMKYNARQQASALHRTIIRLGSYENLIIVGHSLGSLVAIEYARKHPLMAKRLILCSPPLYQPSDKVFARDNIYITIYKFLRKKPAAVIKGSRYLRANKGLKIDQQTLPAYVKSLESGIENQDAADRLKTVKVPVDIIYGRLDLLLITKNLKLVANANKNIELHPVASGHEVIGFHHDKLVKLINESLHIED
ncbi:alpha/beta hydrolase [Candidatus Saccharibacteria bacterium]|nr:alpha/beta hydrolase [Candidatus Saccharibacteria bacterium]